MERLTVTPENASSSLERAAAVLAEGGLLVYPTETMYGAGVDAANSEAVSKLLKFKARPAGKPVSVLVADKAAAEAVVEVNAQAAKLYGTFLPGPVTVISRDKGAVDPRLVSELGTLGIRISSYPLAQSLAERFGGPITATSANASGKARPYSIKLMLAGLSEHQKGLIDLVLDAGELPHNEPSTVIDTVAGVQEVVRAGASFADLLPPKETSSPEETAAYAEALMGSFLHAAREKPVVFALEGEMGAGKTHFAKGIGAALGVKEPISSPTYILQKEYDGEKTKFIHMDCWRLEGVEPELLGLDEYLKAGTVLAVEWSHPLLAYFSSKADALVGYRILIEHGDGDSRVIRAENL